MFVKSPTSPIPLAPSELSKIAHPYFLRFWLSHFPAAISHTGLAILYARSIVSLIFAGVIDIFCFNVFFTPFSYNNAPKLDKISGFLSIKISLSIKTQLVFPLTPVTSILGMSLPQFFRSSLIIS